MAMIEYGNLNQLLPQRSVTKNQACDFGLKLFRASLTQVVNRLAFAERILIILTCSSGHTEAATIPRRASIETDHQ
jgi:hypothetical protein